MVGLPVGNYQGGNNNEEKEIVDFIITIARKTGMRLHINAGTFIPKPHTPYQWSAQIDEAEAQKKLEYIRRELKPLGHKISIHDPAIATIEGVISRGDEGVGDIIEEAYRRGCRLDAWTEYLRKDIWVSLFEEYRPSIEKIMEPKDPARPLPWDVIDPGIPLVYLKGEFSKSRRGEFTSPCEKNCTHRCGVCSSGRQIVLNSVHDDILPRENGEDGGPPDGPAKSSRGQTYRILFSFAKRGRAVFLPHLGVAEVFSMALTRAGLPVLFSEGFNPLPKLCFAAPLAIGISAEAEIATVDTEYLIDGGSFRELLNPKLPQGFIVGDCLQVTIPLGTKKHSVTSLFWGSAYGVPGMADRVKADDERAYRLGKDLFALNRCSVLAKNLERDGLPDSYFNVYSALYAPKSG
jgi:hypothetical protein